MVYSKLAISFHAHTIGVPREIERYKVYAHVSRTCERVCVCVCDLTHVLTHHTPQPTPAKRRVISMEIVARITIVKESENTVCSLRLEIVSRE